MVPAVPVLLPRPSTVTVQVCEPVHVPVVRIPASSEVAFAKITFL
jgi:hypothetical protein